MGIFKKHSKEELQHTLQECNRTVEDLTPQEGEGFQTEQDEEAFSSAIAHGVGILEEKVARGEATPEQEAALKAFLQQYGIGD